MVLWSLNSPAKPLSEPPSGRFELVHTAPVETHLATPDLPDPVSVWCQAFDDARRRIDIAQYYVTGKTGEPLQQVIDHLYRAGQRGVRIRFLLDRSGVSISNPETIQTLETIPNLTLKYIDYNQLNGGIIHAKYFVIDGRRSYMGSQNFDWRSLKHIHETGLWITDRKVSAQLQAIFNIDWHLQAQLARGEEPTPLNWQSVLADESAPNYLVASPNAFNPPGVGDSEPELPRLLAQAKKEVKIMVMTYAPLTYSSTKPWPYYPVIDDAIRAAAQRGVKIKLMVSDWNTGKPDIDYLKSLQILPNIDIKIVTIPQANEGFIPYARVMHTKAMEIDHRIAWVGTSNWEGGYMNRSRDLEMVMQNSSMAKQISQLHQQLWDSSYADALDLTKDYPEPHPGTE
jgi:phosphatidylserine/phosphatidylglycerophosphate/cardiolipin synthase-like enzyme